MGKEKLVMRGTELDRTDVAALHDLEVAALHDLLRTQLATAQAEMARVCKERERARTDAAR